jgi:hypothetical protein
VYRKWGFVVLAALVAAVGSAHAMTLTGDANIVELLQQSNDIVVGKVANVTDGIDPRGVPYTEVTLQVSESIRGGISGTYTFRQFGLVAPRLTADGTKKMMPAPEGFPRYTAGAELVLMLRPSARLTGFRMPAGVTGGKFEIGPGRVENERGNAGLFSNVRLEQGLGTAKDTRMMVDGGPANPDTFLSFLRRAVRTAGSRRGGCRSPTGAAFPPRRRRHPSRTRRRAQVTLTKPGSPQVVPLPPTADTATAGSGQ